jgi:hypothetical protein
LNFILQDGKVYLSLLSIVELETLLTTAYKDYVSTCTLCKHVVIQVSSSSHMFCKSFLVGCEEHRLRVFENRVLR